MFKRNVALWLAVLLLLGIPAACGRGADTSAGGDSGSSAAESKPADSGESKSDSKSAPAKEETAEEAPVSDSAADEAPAADNSAVAAAIAAAPEFEDIVFPDSLPAVPPMADPSWYAYDDLTETYKAEFLTHHYGVPPLPKDQDVVLRWLEDKFNLDITLTAVTQADMETLLSTRYASGDEPEVTWVNNREVGFQLSDQGLLWDAREIYPFMPQTVKFATKNMITWSTNRANGELPFITKYGIQDGVWGYAIRKDWLAKFGMKEPTNMSELLDYAKACVEGDPNGDGSETWFMSGAGNGKAFGMLDGFAWMFGHQQVHVENGELVHPYFDGSFKKFLEFIKLLNDSGYLTPDWFTIDWEPNKVNTMNDKVGMVWYPAGALFGEYAEAKKSPENNNKPMDALEVWHYWKKAPIEGGKYDPNGNPGYCWGFSKRKVDSQGKMLRLAHMIDTMCIGGENFFQTIQGSTDEVYEAAGIKVLNPRTTAYLPDGTFYLSNQDLRDSAGVPITYPYGADDGFAPVGIWQHFGLSVIWQITDPNKEDPYDARFAQLSNEYNQVIANGYERWPNDGLLVSLSGTAAEKSAEMQDWIWAQRYAFVSGQRDMNEYDNFTAEWLDRGGREIISQFAEQLGTPMPSWAN